MGAPGQVGSSAEARPGSELIEVVATGAAQPGSARLRLPSPCNGSGGSVGGCVSTLVFTVLAGAIAALAMLWLLIVDRPKPVMRSRWLRRGRVTTIPISHATTAPAVAYRRPGPLGRLKAIFGLSAMTVAIGIVLAFSVIASVAAAALALRQLTR